MLYVLEDGTIKLTRGDTAKLDVSITEDQSGQEIEINDTDILTLTVKRSINDSEPSFQKIITGSTTFHIEPSDTSKLKFGKYIYDVQMSSASGDVYTVIEPSTFELLKEVTC